jgi:hypothetical protein
MTDPIKIYFHIGSGKTGTSTIQAFLNNNRKILFSDHSCLYPNTGARGKNYAQGDCRNHVGFFKNNDNTEIIQGIRDFIAFSREKKIKNIVFSWEGLFERPRFARIIRDAIEGFDDIRPYILLYLRRQDHWLESAWKQWFAMKKEYADFDHFVHTYEIRWKDFLTIWSDYFGIDQIIVQPYESVQLEEGLIENFLKKTGIEYKGNYWIEVEKQDYNLGLSEEIIEILHLNRNYYPEGDSSELQNFFSNSLPDTYRKKPYEKYSLISPRQRIEILRQYEPVNRYIAEHFLKRADGRLFYEPWPSGNEPWERPKGITAETMVPIFAYLIYSMVSRREKSIWVRMRETIKINIKYYFWKFSRNKKS